MKRRRWTGRDVARATRMRADGARYREIAGELDLTHCSDAWRLVNGDRAREIARTSKARRA